MAFVQSPIPEQEQNQFSPTGQTTSNPLSLLPPQAAQTGGSSGQGGGTASSPNAGTPTQFGSSASKLSDYLNANQGQVQQMANQIAGNLGQNFGQVQQDINAAGNTVSGQVVGAYTPQDPTLVSQAATNPTGVAGNPQSLAEFQSMYNDQYKGPSSFETSNPYAQVQNEVQNAVQNANLINTPGGLSSYLQNNIEQNPTAGQTQLDTTLLQGNPNAVQAIQNAAAPYSSLTGSLSNLATQEDQSIQQAQQNAQAAQQAAQGAYGTAAQNFANTVNQELGTAEQGFVNDQNALNNYVSALQKPGLSGLTPTQMRQLGIDPTVINEFIGAPTVQSEMQGAWNNLPALPTLGAGATDFTFPTIAAGAGPNAANVATPQDYATLAALTSLSGTAPASSPISAATANEAGTYQAPNFTPTANSKGLAQNLYNQMNTWNSLPSVTPKGSQGNAEAADQDYGILMNTLAQYLGLPAYNSSFPTQQPPPTNGGGGLGGPGTPGGV